MSDKEKMDLENVNEPEATAEETKVEETKQPAKSEKSDAPKKKPSDKKEKAKSGGRVSRYFREMKSELKKVAWPSRKQTINNTGIVIVCVIIVGIFVWIFDGIASQIISALLNLFGR